MGSEVRSIARIGLCAAIVVFEMLCVGAFSAAQAGQDLSITLKPSASTLLGRSGHVDILVNLQNTSGHTLEIKDGNVEGLYFVDVRDSSGNQVPLTELGNSLYAGTKVFGEGVFRKAMLQPGEAIQKYVSVERIYNLSQPGTYSIQLTREIDDQSGPHYIRSNTVSVPVRQ
jgi:hypothetical protein